MRHLAAILATAAVLTVDPAFAATAVWIDTDAACGHDRLTDVDGCWALLLALCSPAARVPAPRSPRRPVSFTTSALAGQAGRQAAGAASGSPAPAKGVAGVVTRFAAWIAAAIADELCIRHDMRQLRAMDDGMLNDIGLTRADVGPAVRYGRDW